MSIIPFLCCFFLSLGSVTSTVGRCLSDWKEVQVGNKATCMKVFYDTNSFKEAKTTCEGLAHKKAKLFNAEDGLLELNVLRKKILGKTPTDTTVWFRASDKAVQSLYNKLIIGPAMATVSDYKPCSLVKFASANNKWTVHKCKSSNTGYICQQPDPCTYGWTKYKSGNITTCVKLFSETANVATAEKRCKGYGFGDGGLVKIDTPEFNEFIRNDIVENAPLYGLRYTIGIKAVDGKFTYTDGSCFKFADWQPWRRREKKRCLELFKWDSFWKIRPSSCKGKNSYICSYSVQEMAFFYLDTTTFGSKTKKGTIKSINFQAPYPKMDSYYMDKMSGVYTIPMNSTYEFCTHVLVNVNHGIEEAYLVDNVGGRTQFERDTDLTSSFTFECVYKKYVEGTKVWQEVQGTSIKSSRFSVWIEDKK